MTTRRSQHVTARITVEQEALYEATAQRLGVSLSELVVSALDAVCGPATRGHGWECRGLHVVGDRVVGVGEEPSARVEGQAALVARRWPVIAPGLFWQVMEAVLAGETTLSGTPIVCALPVLPDPAPRKKRKKARRKERLVEPSIMEGTEKVSGVEAGEDESMDGEVETPDFSDPRWR